MMSKINESSDITNITCPYCEGSLAVSVYCESIPCCHCSRHINVKEILSPAKKVKSIPVGTKEVFCFKCGKEIYADKNAQAVSCVYCYNRNDLSDYKVKSILGKNLQTHGTLYLKKKGTIDISSVLVGNAVIEGKINGDLTAMGTVEILKHGEVYGKITCRKLIVKKGGIFEGSVRMLNIDADD
ncbi:MAG: hypothetical protein FJ264_15870 [Planctomycetes bacterium]|nr:hypothetical protein [Planctomycetota bacterium]